MPRIAIISDIHSNMAALEAVLRDIDHQRVDAIYCLGDIVGYGPQPVEAMIRILEVCTPGKVILGNHDHASIYEPIGFNAAARNAALWTNSQIRAGMFGWLTGKKRRWEWLKNLPTSFTEGDVLFVHASPRNHLEEYILEEHTLGRSYLGEDPRQLLEENFALVPHTCFIGHTHRPGVITGDDFAWHSIKSLNYRWVIDQRKTIINVGSVGQPRDQDPRSCYVIFDGESVEWRRVPYDIEATRRLIYANPHLDNHLGDRLLVGR
ncbi:MAG: metallophosphoesterase family protein [Planctomycetota bacterium]|nr:metallophosphatase family protein [Planctomycetota bacterium]MCX8040448.1 metallophosphatase family protein [Planctomycetota bacterium]MDW8373196.1 metallophosphoesterase family protein [Planctomycetota bacterium]